MMNASKPFEKKATKILDHVGYNGFPSGSSVGLLYSEVVRRLLKRTLHVSGFNAVAICIMLCGNLRTYVRPLICREKI